MKILQFEMLPYGHAWRLEAPYQGLTSIVVAFALCEDESGRTTILPVINDDGILTPVEACLEGCRRRRAQ